MTKDIYVLQLNATHLFHTSWRCAFEWKGTQRDVIARSIRDRISPDVRWKKLSTWPSRDTPTHGQSLRVIAYGSCTRCSWGWAFPFNALTSIPIWSHAKKEVTAKFFIISRSECLRGGFSAVIIDECVNPFNPSRTWTDHCPFVFNNNNNNNNNNVFIYRNIKFTIRHVLQIAIMLI